MHADDTTEGSDRTDAAADARPGATAADVPDADEVARALAEVRDDLARRRASGELPELDHDELERHFDGVVESVEAGLDLPPLETGDLTGPAVLETWRPLRGRPGPLARVVGLLLSPLTRALGVVVRRQVGEFSTRTARVVEELAQRQNRLSAFVARTFLDRQRRLEYRVAALERELERLRGELRAATPDAASDAAPAAAPDGPGAAEGPGGESV